MPVQKKYLKQINKIQAPVSRTFGMYIGDEARAENIKHANHKETKDSNTCT